jgi:hypothetical protein
MTYLLFARQENDHINSNDVCDVIFYFDLTHEAVVQHIAEAILATTNNRMIDAVCGTSRNHNESDEYTFYIFADGKRVSPDITNGFIELAIQKATDINNGWKKKAEEEMIAKAKAAVEQQEKLDRANYERLKAKFEPTEVK